MRTPSMGPRGEGWVAGQAILLVAIAGAGLQSLAGAAAPDTTAVVAAALGIVAIALGGVAVVRGVLDLGSSLTPFPRPADANVLVETGIYRLVRHPIYSGIVLASLGWALATRSPVTAILAVALLAWFDLKARHEEAWLVERHPAYAGYRARTRKLIPFVY